MGASKPPRRAGWRPAAWTFSLGSTLPTRAPCWNGRNRRLPPRHFRHIFASLHPRDPLFPIQWRFAMASEAPASAPVIAPEQLLKHWQGHRALTRRVIDAFPEDQLFSFTVGGMRTFGDLAWEFIQMALPTIRGVVTGAWTAPEAEKPTTKAEILRLWDEDTAEIDRFWGQLSPQRFQETDTAFGQWTMPVYDLLLYIIDNEVHHRGQGYVYLRALGIEPPPFWERG
jgi:uncharacterized damage-inducible protein DinB